MKLLKTLCALALAFGSLKTTALMSAADPAVLAPIDERALFAENKVTYTKFVNTRSILIIHFVRTCCEASMDTPSLDGADKDVRANEYLASVTRVRDFNAFKLGGEMFNELRRQYEEFHAFNKTKVPVTQALALTQTWTKHIMVGFMRAILQNDIVRKSFVESLQDATRMRATLTHPIFTAFVTGDVRLWEVGEAKDCESSVDSILTSLNLSRVTSDLRDTAVRTAERVSRETSAPRSRFETCAVMTLAVAVLPVVIMFGETALKSFIAGFNG